MSGTEVAAAGVPGLYGKVPARGDFVTRRLDAQFVAAWDAWLQQAMSETRRALGSRWLECFLSAPVWRFVLPPGMFSRTGWAGVLLPSVDRVGRYFPLTLAAALVADALDARRTLLNAMAWLEALEAAGLEALSPELDLEGFDRRLARLAPPADVAAALPLNDDTVPLGGTDFEVWPLTADGAPNAPALGRSASSAIWMTAGGESVAAALAACAGAIPGERFCALLDGRWKEHGWTVLQPKLYCDPKNPGVDLIHGQGTPGGAVPPLTASPESHNGAQGGARVGEESSS